MHPNVSGRIRGNGNQIGAVCGAIMAAQVIMKNACIEALGAEEANILINGVVVTLSLVRAPRPDTFGTHAQLELIAEIVQL